ncbi:hypothetical protein Lal_00008348 [Lupinus albus]|nr:hypothetical protein Lal_00008348 [Lupinus albus]
MATKGNGYFEKKSLSKMSLAALFGKLHEHDLELSQLDQHGELEKKKKNISLEAKAEKYDSSEDEDEKEETDDKSLFVKKVSKFLRRNKGGRTGQIKKFSKSNEASTSNQNFTCFECGKPGHMKMDCPNIKKSSFKGKNELKNGRRAYISWQDNDTSSASEPKSEEQTHLSLMASHHSDNDEFELGFSPRLEEGLSILTDSRPSEKYAPGRELSSVKCEKVTKFSPKRAVLAQASRSRPGESVKAIKVKKGIQKP